MSYTSLIDTFLAKKSDLQKLVLIYGPTGSGKTSLSIDIAQHLGTEIISTDSRQIFRDMNIGTGKITPEQMQWVPHHMLDILEPHQQYSVWAFKKEAENIISDLHRQSKIPVLCGGTGLYIDSIIYDFAIPKIPAAPELRQQLEAEAEQYGTEYVYQKLQDIDPEYAEQVHPNNLNYVIRWIEVKMLSWKSKTASKGEKKLKYDVLFLCPWPNGQMSDIDIKSESYREWLYYRINFRVAQMFEEGLVEEVQALLSKYGRTKILTDTIGYTEIIEYLDNKISLSECIELTQQHNRNYAKRQLTWFRKYR